LIHAHRAGIVGAGGQIIPEASVMSGRAIGKGGVVAALGLGMLLGPDAVADAGAAERPNVLLILSDDHSAAFLGCASDIGVKTPVLDRLAGEGIRFERAYVTTPQCVPSRASLMTGRSPVAIAMTRFSAPLPADVPALPDLLRASGYYTGVCGRTFHLDGSGNQDPATAALFEKHHLKTFADRVDYLRTGGRPQTLEQVEEFLGRVPEGKPFFLWANFSDPHRPLDADAIPEPHDPAALRLPAHFADTPLVREDLARYCDEVARLDGDVGTVLRLLRDRGEDRETIVIFMGDNGGALLRGKGTLHDLGVRVPLIVRWPGVVAPGQTGAELISGEDLAPTLLEAAGVAVPKAMTGRSFLKRLKGEPFAGREHVFTQRGAHGSGLPTGSAAFDLGRGVTSRTHRLIYNALWQIPYAPVDFAADPFWKDLAERNARGELSPEVAGRYFAAQRPMFELYDLETDPAELRNLAGKPEAAQVERALKAALQEWMILERDFVPLPIPGRPPGAQAKAQAKAKRAAAGARP
jgi:arylsulfatase A-like enzyme